MLLTTQKDPFSINSAYFVKKNIDFGKMNLAANGTIDHTNFKCFSKVQY